MRLGKFPIQCAMPKRIHSHTVRYDDDVQALIRLRMKPDESFNAYILRCIELEARADDHAHDRAIADAFRRCIEVTFRVGGPL